MVSPFSQRLSKTFSIMVPWICGFGPSVEILPSQVLEGFQLFQLTASCPTYFSKLFNFWVQFSVPWILCWDYSIINEEPGFPVLARQIRVKWWTNYPNFARINVHVIHDWILNNMDQVSVSTAKLFSSKSKIQATIASASSRKDYKKFLLEAWSQINSDSDEDDNTPFSQDNVGNYFDLLWSKILISTVQISNYLRIFYFYFSNT